MADFATLPLELLPEILTHIVRPSHLATICLVNKAFRAFGVPLLYARVFIYAWHKDGKARVLQLFRTLGTSPHLAKYVQQLSIRDFPRGLTLSEREEILRFCLQGIDNLVNLRSCTWTRDGSLNTELLEALQRLPLLRELEINGHNGRYYDFKVLQKFSHLSKISLIMPSIDVINVLPAWVATTASSLRHLTLICKSSTLVNDGLLEGLSKDLCNLEHLYLVGCPKVTHVGVWAIISNTHVGLKGLGIEGVASTFDMARLSELCSSSLALKHLQSLTLAVDDRHNWNTAVLQLLSASRLERFHVSSLGGEVGGDLDEEFCASIVTAHGERLRRFSVHRLRASLASVQDICRRCPNLEQLFIVMDRGDMDHLGPCLSLASGLRTVHIHRPMASDSDTIPVVPSSQLLSIVKHCSWNLHQFGCNTRVYRIERVRRVIDTGEVVYEPQLAPYESPEIPEQFLVVRT